MNKKSKRNTGLDTEKSSVTQENGTIGETQSQQSPLDIDMTGNVKDTPTNAVLPQPIKPESSLPETITELRLKIDQLGQLTKGLKPVYVSMSHIDSAETFAAAKSFFMAKAWLGKVLQELGVDSPYKSGYKTKDDIESTADQSSYVPDFSEKSLIERVDWMRSEARPIVEAIKNINSNKDSSQNIPVSREFAIARTNAYTHLCEAIMNLGFELGRIRES